MQAARIYKVIDTAPTTDQVEQLVTVPTEGPLPS